MEKRLRQAIVVIHGMGEQRPLDTLRSGALAAIPARDDGPPLISRPDKVTDGYDARRYLARESDEHQQTEVYEYHWAHLMEGNKVSHIVPLVKRVMFRLPFRLPGKLVPFWLLLWGVVVLAGVVTILTWDTAAERNINGILRAVGAGGVGIFAVTQGIKFVSGFVSSSFVDVVRYTDAAPGNQRVRDEIRAGAVDLLEGLHEGGRYDRIIVMAHSLGSFIAYDAIAYLWPRMNQRHTWLKAPPNGALKRLEEIGRQVADGTATAAEYQAAQRDAWVERRQNGCPWLITDLVTLGSPLAHSHILFAKDRGELEEKQDRLEAPRCPPIPDFTEFEGATGEEKKEDENKKVKAWHALPWYSYETVAGEDEPLQYEGRTARIIYHAAPFAVVRWTALYLPMDLFAGKLADNFGRGILDIEVKSQKRQKVPVMAHTTYFKYHVEPLEDGSVETLRRVLDLDSGSWLRGAVDSSDDA